MLVHWRILEPKKKFSNQGSQSDSSKPSIELCINGTLSIKSLKIKRWDLSHETSPVRVTSGDSKKVAKLRFRASSRSFFSTRQTEGTKALAKNNDATSKKHNSSESSSNYDDGEKLLHSNTTRHLTSATPMTSTTKALPTAITVGLKISPTSTSTSSSTVVVPGSATILLQPTPTSTPETNSTASLKSTINDNGNIIMGTTSRTVYLDDSKGSSSAVVSPVTAQVIGGVIGGFLGVCLIAFIIFIKMKMRRRQKQHRILDMMAPSQLRGPFFQSMRTDPRQSFTWVGPLDKPSNRRGSQLI